MDALDVLGFSDWFRSKADSSKLANYGVARIVSVHKDSYVLTAGLDDAFAELSGNLMYTADSPLDLPTTGDWVYADFYDDTHAIIHGVIARKTLIKRKAAGKLVDYQLIAANIDVAFIVQSVDYNLNLRRLERYLVMVNDSEIEPVILLSKCDLVSSDELDDIAQRVSAISPGTTVLAFSNTSGKNIDAIKGFLYSGKSYCLLGSSGVGKTSLLNSIIGGDRFDTQLVSKKDSKGRHTTTSRQLIRLENGAMLIDTPGMRELGNLAIEAGLEETFSEIDMLAQSCKFADCSHTTEQDCAIMAAIETGELASERYENYKKMKNESAFHEMSYVEKRKKDKRFGKMVKSAVKNKNRR